MTTPRTLKLLLVVVLTAALVLPTLPETLFPGTAFAQESTQRTIELQDIMDWKRIGGARLSEDGSWLAYRLAPAEGNGEIIVRSTQDETEYRFPVGSGGAGLTRPAARETGISRSSSSSVHRPLLWMPLMTRRGEYSDIAQPLVPITCPVTAPPTSVHR